MLDLSLLHKFDEKNCSATVVFVSVVSTQSIYLTDTPLDISHMGETVVSHKTVGTQQK